MVNVVTSSVVDRGFEPWSCQTKDYNIGICLLLGEARSIKIKSKDCLAQNHDNMSSRATCLSTDCCFSELTQ
jgi:hypothetical protein